MVGATLGLVALVAAGGLFASNMGFKLNYPLQPTTAGVSANGTSSLGLPYNPQTNITNAKILIDDINTTAGSSVVLQVQRYIKTSNSYESYTGVSGTAFPITPGEGYLVQVSGLVNYIIVGSENPGLVIVLDATGTNGSASGKTFYSYPYHSVSNDAKELIDEINAAAGSSVVLQIERYVKATNSYSGYTGVAGTAFPLVAGESYLIQVNANSSFVPAHF
jgi:ribosomal protein L21E